MKQGGQIFEGLHWGLANMFKCAYRRIPVTCTGLSK